MPALELGSNALILVSGANGFIACDTVTFGKGLPRSRNCSIYRQGPSPEDNARQLWEPARACYSTIYDCRTNCAVLMKAEGWLT